MLGDPKDSNCTWGEFAFYVVLPVLLGVVIGGLIFQALTN